LKTKRSAIRIFSTAAFTNSNFQQFEPLTNSNFWSGPLRFELVSFDCNSNYCSADSLTNDGILCKFPCYLRSYWYNFQLRGLPHLRVPTSMFFLAFHGLLFQNKTAEKQNAFLSQFMTPYAPKQKRPRTATPKSRTSVQYLIRKQDSTLVAVCAATFRSVTGISKFGPF